MHAAQQPGCIEFAQVAPDRVFRGGQAGGQFCRQYPALALDGIDDRITPFFG